MTNDNNQILKLIVFAVLIALIYILYDSRTKSKSNKSNESNDFFENFSNNTAKSPLLNNKKNNILDLDTYNQLMTQFDTNKDPSKKREPSVYSDGKQYNKNQKLLESPPSQPTYNRKGNAEKVASTSTDRQPVYPGDNQQLNYQGNSTKNKDFGFDSYMLLPNDSMPDEKFKKVMPAETRQTLTSKQLLPEQSNPDWFDVPNSKFNLMQAVDLEVPEIKIGIDTVGQSRKNATYDLRAAPQNPKFIVSPWQNSGIEPDYNTRPLC